MFGKLGSVREPVDLSVAEALASAEEFLTQHGYSIVHGTDVSVFGERQKRRGISGKETFHLAVYVRPRPEGGVRIELCGNDREGVRERQGEWSMWAESLPKVAPGVQEDERADERVPRAETTEPRVEHSKSEATESRTPEEQLLRDREQDAAGGGESRGNKMREEAANGGKDEEKTAPDKKRGAWMSAAPWERKVRTAPGKADEGPNRPT